MEQAAVIRLPWILCFLDISEVCSDENVLFQADFCLQCIKLMPLLDQFQVANSDLKLHEQRRCRGRKLP